MADKFNSPIDIPEVSSSPGAPAAGYSRIYSKTDGKVYKKNAADVEVELSYKGIVLLGSAPGSPSTGELWFDTETGKLFIYYTDVDSSQWIELGSNGINGLDGAVGSIWRDGTGVPSNGLGVNGDYYLNDANGDVYLKSSGTYSIVANIRGTAAAWTQITQAAYNALSPPDSNTLYVIVG